MDQAKQDELLFKRANDFLEKENLSENLIRNGHMNRYNGESFDVEKAGSLFDLLILGSAVKGTMALDVLDSMVKSAKQIHNKETVTPVIGLPINVTDALMVALINHVAYNWCIDFGLYTEDLEKD